MPPPVPGVEVADDADAARVRRPDAEGGSFDALELHRVGAEFLVELQMAALAEKILVHLPEHRPEPIGVLLDPFMVARGKLETIGEALRPPVEKAREETFRMNPLQRADRRAGLVDDGHGRGRRQEGVDEHRRPLPAMHAEHDEGIAMAATDDRLDVRRIGGCGLGHAGSRARISRRPRSGMSTQVGRLASS